MLLEIVERISSETNRKSTIYRLACDSCARVIEASRCRYIRGPTHFCDNKCRGKYRHDHPEIWKKAIEALNSDESHAKAKSTIQEKAARGEWRHWLGKKHTEETKKHLSDISSNGARAGEKNGMFGRKHDEYSKEKMSESKTRLILEGKFRPGRNGHKKGWYESPKTGRRHFFRSSWEEAVMKHLDSSECIATWDYECVRIPYTYNNHKRWYVPDFIITYTDGKREMLEVKPEALIQSERVTRTAEAGRKYCAANGIDDYIIVTRKILDEWKIVVG